MVACKFFKLEICNYILSFFTSVGIKIEFAISVQAHGPHRSSEQIILQGFVKKKFQELHKAWPYLIFSNICVCIKQVLL